MSSPGNNIAPRVSQSFNASLQQQSLQQAAHQQPAAAQKITKIVTSKEWVLPPRPKPGRKPSIDTPSTKRKAQNRAAQRAFRERRANRVSELEDKILEIEKERSIKEGLMNNHIKNLTLENQKLNKIIEELKRQSGLVNNKQAPSQPVMPVQQDELQQKKYISPISSAATSPNNTAGVMAGSPNDNDSNCGICLKDDCLCESIGVKVVESFEPMAAVPLRKRKSTENDENALELDFTNKFKFKKMPDLSRLKVSKPKQETEEYVAGQHFQLQTVQPLSQQIQYQQQQQQQQQARSLRLIEEEDNCGFCSDDTPCVCREAAKEVENLSKMNEMLNNEIETNLPPLKNISRQHSLPVLHPGPTVEFNKSGSTSSASGAPSASATDTNNTASMTPTNNGTDSQCSGNPGTCTQCQTDPMSTLFCTTIANKDGPTSINTSNNTSNESMERATMKKEGNEDVFISTADAYKTLSRHENFNLINFNTLIGKLTTRGMLVEAGSVAGVLRELDRKFSCSQ